MENWSSKAKILSYAVIFAISVLLIYCNYHRVAIKRGTPVDSLNGVEVYHNGATWNSDGRTVRNGYNIGLKYQCVEFVKRYYYEHYNHKMPDSYGHAKDFYDKSLSDRDFNKARGLMQHQNGGYVEPSVGDIIVFDASPFNKYGHVAIISEVTSDGIEIIQQNYGPVLWSRRRLKFIYHDNRWIVDNDRVLGWLRRE